MQGICDDLRAEHASLDAVLERVDDWDLDTPAEGWTIRDTISHLWFFDQQALLAIDDPDAFTAAAAELVERGTDVSVEPGRTMSAGALWEAWRRDRDRLVVVAESIEPDRRVPWYGPAMGARSFVTARLMETWAHGQDIADAVGVERPATSRLRHVAHIGVRARRFSYAVNDRPMPDREVYVALDAPDGTRWEWGDPASADRVTGPALDFCLLVTQRCHIADTALAVTGEAAVEWMAIAQAFAGPPGAGRPPRGSVTAGR